MEPTKDVLVRLAHARDQNVQFLHALRSVSDRGLILGIHLHLGEDQRKTVNRI